MELKKLTGALSIALALGTPLTATTAAGAATVHMAEMSVTKTGTFEKLSSMSSFLLKVGMKTYTVKVDAMTHITHNGMKEKLSSLKKGEELTVKGQLEMGTIIATSVVIGM